MRAFTFVIIPLMLVVFLPHATASADEDTQRPIRALLITGGCCHNYEFQTRSMQEAARQREVDVQWKVIHDGGGGTQAKIGLYDDPQWAEGFDVVVHNECFADTKDPQYIRRITAAHHAGVDAVVIHCAMHTYRAAEIDDWRNFLGVTSRRHDHQSRYPVRVVAQDHPIMQGFPRNYRTQMDELYIIEKIGANTEVLAESISQRDGTSHPVFWTNRFGEARIFGTTYGHSDEMFSDAVFLDTLVKGLQWAAASDAP